jgi:hypothetical protein
MTIRLLAAAIISLAIFQGAAAAQTPMRPKRLAAPMSREGAPSTKASSRASSKSATPTQLTVRTSRSAPGSPASRGLSPRGDAPPLREVVKRN